MLHRPPHRAQGRHVRHAARSAPPAARPRTHRREPVPRRLPAERPRPHLRRSGARRRRLVAAGRTAPREREAHSLHGYFLRPGEPAIPILYEVDPIRDGRSFTTRRVRAIQRGEAIFNMAVSYQVPEEGFEHQSVHEKPAEPEGETYEDAIRAEIARHGLVIEADDRRFDLPIEVRTARRSAPRGLRRGARPACAAGCARAARCPTTCACTSACWPTRRT